METRVSIRRSESFPQPKTLQGSLEHLIHHIHLGPRDPRDTREKRLPASNVPVRLWTVKALSHGSIGGTGYSMDRIFLSKRQKKTMVSGCVMDWKARYLPGKRHAFQFQTLRFSARARARRDRRRSEALRLRWLVVLEFSKFWGGLADAEKRLL